MEHLEYMQQKQSYNEGLKIGATTIPHKTFVVWDFVAKTNGLWKFLVQTFRGGTEVIALMGAWHYFAEDLFYTAAYM